MSDVVEEIRCALAMSDAGYAVIFDHETSAELLRRYDIAVKALEKVAAMDPNGIRADDLGRAARIAAEGIRDAVGGSRDPA